MSTNKERPSELGASLIELVIVMGILATLVPIFLQLSSGMSKHQAKMDLDTERTQVQRTLQEAISCDQTELNVPDFCKTNNIAIDVYDATGQKIIDAKGSKWGRFTVSATCRNTKGAEGLEIRAARVKSGVANPLAAAASDFLEDPLTGKTITWNSPAPKSSGREFASSLFAQNARPCRTKIAGATPLDPGQEPKQPISCQQTTFYFTTPGQKIPSNRKDWLAGASIQNGTVNSEWVNYNITCPTDHPVLMNVSIKPSCGAPYWQAANHDLGPNETYPRRGFCGVIFAAVDNPKCGATDFWRVARCTSVCCAFKNNTQN